MDATKAEIRWRVHPAAERKVTAAAVLATVVGLAVLAGFWMGGIYWGIFAGLVLFLSLEAFYLPTQYELGAEQVGVRKPFSRVARPWSTFRSAWFDPTGVTLSPFGRRHWLESYRGIRVRYPVAGAAVTASEIRRALLARLDPGRTRCHGLGADDAAAWEQRRAAVEAATAGAVAGAADGDAAGAASTAPETPSARRAPMARGVR